MKIGINGFGRIGRAIYRINLRDKDFEVVAVNDINPDIENIAYTLKYDSTYGILPEEVSTGTKSIYIGEDRFKVFNYKSTLDVPWGDLDVDIVIDSSGVQQNVIDSKFIDAKNVIITYSPPEKYLDTSVVFGVNENEFKPKHHKVVSSSICDTVAFTPVAKILDDIYGINHVFITTLHPWLQYQNLLDGQSASVVYPGTSYPSYVLGRASTESLIPKPTTVGNACLYVMPELEDKISCYSFRVPIGHISAADLTFELDSKITKDEINELFIESQNDYIGYNDEPKVSIDFLKDEHSVIVDGRWTQVMNDKYLKLVIWYDNEWGYSKRVMDLCNLIKSLV